MPSCFSHIYVFIYNIIFPFFFYILSLFSFHIHNNRIIITIIHIEAIIIFFWVVNKHCVNYIKTNYYITTTETFTTWNSYFIINCFVKNSGDIKSETSGYNILCRYTLLINSTECIYKRYDNYYYYQSSALQFIPFIII